MIVQQTATDQIAEFNNVVKTSVEDTLNTIMNRYKFGARDFQAWTIYFNVPLEDDDDYHVLIAKAKLVSNLLDECQNNLSQARASSSYYEYHEYVNSKHYNQESSAKTLRGKEREASERSANVIACKRQTDVIVEFFETQMWRLRNKGKTIDSLIMAESTILKYIKNDYKGF